MRIDRIHLSNFKLFEDFELTLNPEFTLLIGENGSGKTSILDALAIACGVWLYEVPDSRIANSRLSLSEDYIRLEAKRSGDRIQFTEALNMAVSAWGELLDGHREQWTQGILLGKRNKQHLKQARDFIAGVFRQAVDGNDVTLPVIAYYGAGRAWLPHNERSKVAKPSFEASRRWEAFYDCLNERIRITDLKQWFWDEATERGNRAGKYRPGFEVVKQAIVRCIPDADDAWFDTDRKDIVLSIGGSPQPFANLSAGQRTMLALVADIAVKAVTQNNYLVPPDELGPDDQPLPRVLAETPGVVLIDELDVHLHPRWQRKVVEDLRSTFPKIQFVATTHSAFIIQSLRPEELRNLQGQAIPELGNMGVEEIARGLMNVPRPDVGSRYAEMVEVAKGYLLRLEEADKTPPEKLSEFEAALANKIAPYADNPAFQAYLELKREGKLSRHRRSSDDSAADEGP
ncbi:MAG: AAA family ATPase [Planctomycetales bacterium]|nr:AAA family ATPase [Planctomycetales bacterium]